MAGLFSLIYFALCGAGAAADDIRTESYKSDSKKKALAEGNKTYTDGRGNEYFIETNTLCEKVQDKRTGHWILRELDDKRIPTGKVLYDFDKYAKINERNELSNMIAAAREKGMKYFLYSFDYDVKYLSSKEVRSGYDIEKEKRYIIYKYGDKYYCSYMENEPYKYKEGCNFTVKECYAVSGNPLDTFDITKDEYKLRRMSIE